MNARIRKFITGVHMGLGHDGLAKLLRKSTKRGGADIDLAELGEGDLVMCMNKQGDKMKVIGHKGLVIGYLKLPNKRKIMLEAVQFIPTTFGGAGFDYDAACRSALAQRFSDTLKS